MVQIVEVHCAMFSGRYEKIPNHIFTVLIVARPLCGWMECEDSLFVLKSLGCLIYRVSNISMYPLGCLIYIMHVQPFLKMS